MFLKMPLVLRKAFFLVVQINQMKLIAHMDVFLKNQYRWLFCRTFLAAEIGVTARSGDAQSVIFSWKYILLNY
jgi:hypothetical protein